MTFYITQNKTNVQFLALIELSGLDATSIVHEIETFYQKHNLPLKYMVMLTNDGVAVMIGRSSGVGAKLQVNIGLSAILPFTVS